MIRCHTLQCSYLAVSSIVRKLIDGENEVSLLLMSPLSGTVPHTEQLLKNCGGRVSGGQTDTFT